MRTTFPDVVERGRDLTPMPNGATSEPGDPYGRFLIRLPVANVRVCVIACAGEGWDHVSVSLQNRCPTWAEMCEVKDMFFEPEECVIQYHPPRSVYVNTNPNVLHLWRPLGVVLPMPPVEFV